MATIDRLSKKGWNEIREMTLRRAISEVKEELEAGRNPIRRLEQFQQCAAFNLIEKP